MKTRTTRRTHAKSLIAVGALALAVLIPAVTAGAQEPDGVHDARNGTVEYHHVGEAREDGYKVFRDVNGIACIDNPGVGAMGIHYVNGALVNDPHERAASPEAVIYEPEPNGRLRLVAVEYIVTQSAWVGAGHSKPPSLFGQTFTLQPSPNRYGLPPFYELHAWIWKHNPLGMFNDWNPRVSCAAA